MNGIFLNGWTVRMTSDEVLIRFGQYVRMCYQGYWFVWDVVDHRYVVEPRVPS